jgi:hypothetical protein
MKKENEIRRELEQLGASKLACWHKPSVPDSLPDEYWNEQVHRVIAASSNAPNGQVTRRFSLASITAIAAGFLMLLAGSWMFFQYANTESGTEAMTAELALITDEAIVKYIDDNLDDFDVALLSNYVQVSEQDFLFEVDDNLDSMEAHWPEDAEWLMPLEEGIELF